MFRILINHNHDNYNEIDMETALKVANRHATTPLQRKIFDVFNLTTGRE
ncbi:MAG: hypothetical protein SP4CHLAM5_01820 [Chlamydiia bacterium]|nr:hypothetical protein [Chlamydiia bacterium]MCH9618056.1 hypothetical protein [Chlamydiia bacterium]MCH9624686.1 hypothetical protein [Chlamydiia bacterium]